MMGEVRWWRGEEDVPEKVGRSGNEVEEEEVEDGHEIY